MDTLRGLCTDAEFRQVLCYMNITPFIQKEAEDEGINLMSVSSIQWTVGNQLPPV